MKIRVQEGRNGNENTGSQREEWGRIQEGGNENVLCIQEVEERKPKACSSFLWGIRGSHHHSSIHCFDKIFTFCFVAGAKLDILHCLACKNSISKLSLRCQSETNPLQFMQFTFKNRQDGPVRQLTGQRNGRMAARDKNQKAKSNFGNL